MSNPVVQQNETRQLVPPHIAPPGLEPWLAVTASALVPAMLIVWVPQSLQIPLAVATGVLLVAGTCILIVSRRRSGLV